MASPIYDILDALHEDALTEHRQRPSAFTGQVLRVIGEAMAELERVSDTSQRHSLAARKGWAARRSRKEHGYVRDEDGNPQAQVLVTLPEGQEPNEWCSGRKMRVEMSYLAETEAVKRSD